LALPVLIYLWTWEFAWIWCYLAGINTATFGLYAYDKLAAKMEWLRVPEIILHGYALLGGTPAAWIGQRVLRHKTLKGPFQAIFWMVLGVQVLFLSYLWFFWT